VLTWFAQELERDGLMKLEVFGLVDFAHPAPAEQPDDAIAPSKHRTGNESPFTESAG
jgi:hypothetical protein